MSFSERNRRRCESPAGFGHPLLSWSLSDWMVAVTGEVGEGANIIKKLNRVRDGIPGNDKTYGQLREDLADEIADAAIYLDLLAQAAGFDLEEIRDAKFAKTSAKIGYVEEPPTEKSARAVNLLSRAVVGLGKFSDQLAESVIRAADGSVEESRFARAMEVLKHITDAGVFDIGPDEMWWREYLELTGDHYVLTEEGWVPANLNTVEATGEEPAEVLDEVNAPAAQEESPAST